MHTESAATSTSTSSSPVPNSGAASITVPITPNTSVSAPNSAAASSTSDGITPSSTSSQSPNNPTFSRFSLQQWPQAHPPPTIAPFPPPAGGASATSTSNFPAPNASASAHNLAMAGRTMPPPFVNVQQANQAGQAAQVQVGTPGSQSIGCTSSAVPGASAPLQQTTTTTVAPGAATTSMKDDDALEAQTTELFQHAWDGINSDKSASCHQCKTTKHMRELVYCTRIGDAVRKRRCRKKYCHGCLTRSHNIRIPLLSSWEIANWVCPACMGSCGCAACNAEARAKRYTHHHQHHQSVLPGSSGGGGGGGSGGGVLLPPPSTPATADPMQMKQMMKRVYEMIPQQQVQPQTTVMFATQQQPPSLQPQQQPAAQRSGGVPMDQSGSVSTGGAVVMMKLEPQPNQQHGGVIPASGGGDKTGVPMDLVSQQKAQIHMQIQYLEQQKLQLEENLALIEYNNRMLHSNERAKTQPVGMSMHMQAPGMSAMPSVNSLPLATPAYGRVPTGTSGWPLPTAAPTAAIPQAVSQPLPSRNLGGGGVSASSPTNSTSSGVQQGPRSTQDGLPSPPPSSQSSPSPSRSLQPLPDSSGTISSPTMISQSVASTTSAQHHHQVVHPMMMQSSHQLHHQLMNPPPQQQPPMAFPMYAAYGAQPTSGQQGNLNQPPLAQTITTTRQFNASGPQQQQQQQRASSQDLTAPMNNLFYQPNGSPSAVDQQQQQYQTSVYQQQMHQAAHQQQMQHQMNYLFSQQQLQHHLQQQAQPMMHHHVYQTQLAAPTSSPGQAPSGQSLQMQSIQVLHASPTQQQYSISGVSASSSTGGGGSIGGGGGVSSITMSPMPSLSYPSYHGTYFSPNPNSDSSSLSLLAVASTTFDHAGRAISATAATEQSGRAVSATTMPTHHLHASSQASMHSGKPTPLVSLSSFTQQSGESPAGGAAAGGGAYIGPFLHGGTQFMLSPSMMQTQTQSTLKLYVPSGALHSSPSSSFYQPSSGQSSAVSSSHRTPFLDGSPNTANPSPDGSEENNDSSSSSSDITTDEDQHMQDDSTTMQQQQHASQPQHEQHAHPVKVEPMQH